MFLKNKNPEAGFTLIELMIALAITGMITAAMYSVFQAQTRGQRAQDISLQMTQGVRAAMEIMASDIRMAGCDPTEGANAGIEFAGPSDLILTMDITGTDDQPDGDTADANERVRYAINTANHLGRATGAANPPAPLNPLHSIDIECDTLEFVYLTDDGPDAGDDMDIIPYADIDDPTPAEQLNRDNIRAIQVNIRVHWVAQPDRWFELGNTIAVRNL